MLDEQVIERIRPIAGICMRKRVSAQHAGAVSRTIPIAARNIQNDLFDIRANIQLHSLHCVSILATRT